MSKRITCISLFDKESINQIEDLVCKVDYKLCKVPYSEFDRETKDTLPYHLTLQSYSKTQKDEALEILKQIKIEPIELTVNSVNIKNSFDNSYNIYLEIDENKELINIYEQFYSLTKNNKYNPKTYVPHITLHCDKNYEKIISIKNAIQKNLESMKLKFRDIGVFEIYPANRIK